MTDKAKNYTVEMEETLRTVYVPDATQDERTEQIAAISKMVDRPTRSVIAKLTSMGVYVPKVYKTKKGTPVVKKETIVSNIEAVLGAELNGLEKATKKTLELLYKAVAPAEETAEAEEDAS